MSEAYQRYLPPDSAGIPTTPKLVWRRAVALVAKVRFQFVALVVVPTTVAAVYFGAFAAPQYVSHTEYIVRGVDAHRSVGLAALLSTFGVSRAADEISAIESYLKSREAIEKLNARIDLRAVYGSRAADGLSRFPRFWEHGSFEDLYAYTRSYIQVHKEASTGVTSLDVAAFDAASAKAIAVSMLSSASEMSNQLNARAQADMVDASRQEVDEARDDIVKTQNQITAFRDSALLVDPLAFAGAMLQDIGSLALERARAQTQIAEAEKLSPDNPSLQSLKATEGALERKVADERAKLAGDSSALSAKVANYERLTLLLDLAQKRFAGALLSLEGAQADAQHKRIYIEQVVRPNLPDEPTRPERLRSVASVFVVGFIAFSILWILSVGSKDHAQ